MAEVTLLNGRLTPVSRALVSFDDWAVRYGWGLFETVRVHQGCPLFLGRHLHRLCRAAGLLGLSDTMEQDERRWRRDIIRSLEIARMREAVVNCYWSHGAPSSRVRPSRLVRIRPLPEYPKRPLRLWLAPWRLEPTYPGTGVKTMAYFPYIFAGVSARRERCDEALILNTSGRVADGATSSIFAVRQGRLVTPTLADGALAGITRAVVTELAHSIGLPCRESRLRWQSLLDAEDIFVTSALRGIAPVARIAGHWRGASKKSEALSQLRRLFDKRIALEVSQWREST